MTAHSLQSVVDEGFAPSVRWLAEGIKAGRVPGRMIGRYWRTWRMTDKDLADFLDGVQPAPVSVTVEPEADPAPDLIAAGLSARSARRLRQAS